MSPLSLARQAALVSQLSIVVIQWTCGHGPALRRWELQDGRYDGSLRPMSFMMAGSADGSCAAISAAVRAVPAESAATNSLALGKRHSARTTSAEQSVKSVASRARRHCSGRPSAPGGGASVADRLPCRATASNTSDQAILTSGVAHTVKATRPPGFSTRLHSASAACGRGTWFIPKLDTAAWKHTVRIR